ncbi:MAG: OsmC family protein [Bacteroidota bacterium]
MRRTATAFWQGTGKEGSGHLTTQSTVLNQSQYSYNTRFADGVGTNPEELVAAAHAGCFTMKLSFILSAAGLNPGSLETTCAITLDNGAITKSELSLKAVVEGVSNEQFAEYVADAKTNCPISKLLNTEISVEHTLNA